MAERDGYGYCLACGYRPGAHSDTCPKMIANLRADLAAMTERAEDAESRESSMVSVRDLTIRDLRSDLAAARADVERLRAIVMEYADDNCWSGNGVCPNEDGNTCLPCKSRALLAETAPKVDR